MDQNAVDVPERMSDIEALMWALEADPYLSSNFANISILDCPPDIERLRRTLWRATREVPLLRMRVVDERRPQTPRWVEVEDFDIDQHVHHVELPTGSTITDALRLAADITGRPFDPARPLWEFTVVTGLPKGQAAMVQKLHHTITDGEGGLRMSLAFVDFTRDAPEKEAPDDGPPPPTPDTTIASNSGDSSPIGSAIGFFADLTRRGVDFAGTMAGNFTDALRDPAQLASTLAELPAESRDTARSLVRQLGVVDHFRSPLWTERSLDRHLEIFDISLDDVRATGKRLSVSVNDIFIAAITGGAGAYHRERGTDVDELRLSMPVSTRTDKGVGGNSFTPTRVLVPLDADPRVRLRATHERLSVTKSERSLSFTGPLAGLVNFVPPPVLLRIARQQVTTVDFAASNIRAAPMDLFIAGALMLGNYPIGPLGGTALNVTTMSYRGNLNIGLHADTAAVTEPEALAADIQRSFAELLDLKE